MSAINKIRFLLRDTRLDLLLLTVILILFNLPYLKKTFIPVHDTMYQFHLFHLFYSEFFYNHQIAQWLPYSTYGLSAHLYQLQIMTPVMYLMMLFGSVLRIEDAMFIFKWSLIGEQFIFLYGMYRLSSLIHKERGVVFAVCLAAMAGIVWHNNLHINLRFHYMFPYVLYFLTLFFTQKKGQYLWYAGIMGLTWVIGSTPYFISFWIFAVFLLLVLFSIRHFDAWASIFKLKRNNILSLFAFLILSTVLLLHFYQSLSHITFSSSTSRDPVSGATTIENFLSYGGFVNADMLMRGFLLASPLFLPMGAHIDSSIYIGLLPFIFFVLSLKSVNEKLYLPFFVLTILLIWFSLGGIFTRISYYFPGLSYYRHIGYVYGLVRILMLVCAGFGLKQFLEFNLSWGQGRGVLKKYCVLSVILIVLLVDVVIFQLRIFKQASQLPQDKYEVLDSLNVHPLTYQPTRGLIPVTKRQEDALKLLEIQKGTAYYTGFFNFMQFDSCDPKYRVDVILKGVSSLVSLPNTKRGLIGCYTPKLQLIPRALLINDTFQAASAIMDIPDYNKFVVLSGPKMLPVTPSQEKASDAVDSISVRSYNANQVLLDINVKNPQGTWLVYKDAYHPYWRARVNGRDVPIYQAYLAFKAVYLESGRHEVQFFYSRLHSIPGYIIALYGVVWSCFFFYRLFRPRPSNQS